MEPTLTDEQVKDIEERSKQFIEKYTALTEELQIDFSAYPVFVPTGSGVFSVMMNASPRDKKYISQVSPLSP